MAKIRKQIISPYVRFAASSRGPYMNRIGQGAYARSFRARTEEETVCTGINFCYKGEKESFLSNGSYESLVFVPTKNQFIQCGDVGSRRFSVIGADNWISIQTEDGAWFQGSGMGPYTWTDTATSVHVQETEITAANDFAEEIFVISNHNGTTDTPGIWRLVPEQADATNPGNPDKWIIEDFVILPDGTQPTGINPDCAVVIQGTIYMVGTPGTGSAYGSTLSRDLIKYNGMATNTYDLTSLVEFGDGEGQIADLAYDGVYLYAMIVNGPNTWPFVIEQYKWNSESDIRLVQRFDLSKVKNAPNLDLTNIKAMDVAKFNIYLGDNTNDPATAATYILAQPEGLGIDDYIRFSAAYTKDLFLNKGLQFYSRAGSLNVDSIDFSSGKGRFDGTSRVLYEGINRGVTDTPYGGGNSFTVAATLMPESLAGTPKALAFRVGGSATETFGLKADGRWQYRYNAVFVDTGAAVAQVGVEQRIMWAYDSVAETLSLYVDGNDTPVITSSIARDPDEISSSVLSFVIGASNFSGSIANAWIGTITDVVIYNGVLTPSQEPSNR